MPHRQRVAVMSAHQCELCGGDLHPLPIPAHGRAMLSDGRVLATPLAKASCLACGAGTHVAPVSDTVARASYAGDYALATAAPEADFGRASNYMNILATHVAPAAKVLEIGCGSGRLLRELASAWPRASLDGIDPALPAGLPTDGRLRYRRAHFDEVPASDGNHDLIFSINVIEHVASPGDFLRNMRRLLASDGKILLVCPGSLPPNVELMFFDHLHSLTPGILRQLARDAGLVVTRHENHPAGARDFQLFLLEHQAAVSTHGHSEMTITPPAALHDLRSRYLQAWQELPAALLARTRPGHQLMMFGAGQMAALLRAYAPAIWEKTAGLLVDNPADAWNLDKPILRYDATQAARDEVDVIVATAPASQPLVASRLHRDGIHAVRFDDLIPN